MHAILKEQDLDYALHEENPHVPSPIYEYYAERMKEYIPKLEKKIGEIRQDCQNDYKMVALS